LAQKDKGRKRPPRLFLAKRMLIRVPIPETEGFIVFEPLDFSGRADIARIMTLDPARLKDVIARTMKDYKIPTEDGGYVTPLEEPDAGKVLDRATPELSEFITTAFLVLNRLMPEDLQELDYVRNLAKKSVEAGLAESPPDATEHSNAGGPESG